MIDNEPLQYGTQGSIHTRTRGVTAMMTSTSRHARGIARRSATPCDATRRLRDRDARVVRIDAFIHSLTLDGARTGRARGVNAARERARPRRERVHERTGRGVSARE